MIELVSKSKSQIAQIILDLLPESHTLKDSDISHIISYLFWNSNYPNNSFRLLTNGMHLLTGCGIIGDKFDTKQQIIFTLHQTKQLSKIPCVFYLNIKEKSVIIYDKSISTMIMLQGSFEDYLQTL